MVIPPASSCPRPFSVFVPARDSIDRPDHLQRSILITVNWWGLGEGFRMSHRLPAGGENQVPSDQRRRLHTETRGAATGVDEDSGGLCVL